MVPINMKKQYTLSLLSALAISAVSAAGFETDIQVNFELSFDTDDLGMVTIAETFDATQAVIDGALTVSFGGSGSFLIPDAPSGVLFGFSNLAVLLADEDLDGSGSAMLSESGAETDYSFTLTGFGDQWNGLSSSGVGVIEFTNLGFASVDSHQFDWSVTTVPAPGAIGILAIAGLAARRRRH